MARCWLKAESLLSRYQAELVQVSGKGMRHGSRDPEVDEVAHALTALGVGVQISRDGSVVQDEELSRCCRAFRSALASSLPSRPSRHQGGPDAGEAGRGRRGQRGPLHVGVDGCEEGHVPGRD